MVASGRRKNSLENAKIRIKIKEEIIKCFDHLMQGRLERLKFGDLAFKSLPTKKKNFERNNKGRGSMAAFEMKGDGITTRWHSDDFFQLF